MLACLVLKEGLPGNRHRTARHLRILGEYPFFNNRILFSLFWDRFLDLLSFMTWPDSASARISKGQRYQGLLRKRAGSSSGKKGNFHRSKEKGNKIVETYWYDHSLESSWGALSDGTISILIPPFWEKMHFLNLSKKTSVLRVSLLDREHHFRTCSNFIIWVDRLKHATLNVSKIDNLPIEKLYGFLKSRWPKHEIYFHFTNWIMTDYISPLGCEKCIHGLMGH
jgi:hypothetical protein